MSRYSADLAGLVKTLPHEGSMRARVERSIDVLFDYLARHTSLVRILLRETLTSEVSKYAEAALPHFRALLAIGEEALDTAQAEGTIRPVDSQMFILHIYSASVVYFAASANLGNLVDGSPGAPENIRRAREEIKAMVLIRWGFRCRTRP